MKKLLFIILALSTLNTISQTAEDYSIRGNSKHELEDFRGAITDYTKAIEIEPDSTSSYVNRGLSKSYLEDNRGALVDYN